MSETSTEPPIQPEQPPPEAPADSTAPAPPPETPPEAAAPRPEGGEYMRRLRRQAEEMEAELAAVRAENMRLRNAGIAAAAPSDAEAMRAQIRAEDRQAAAARAFTEACNRTFLAGVKEFGEEPFKRAVGELMQAFGPSLQQRPDILEAITELPRGHAVYRALAADPDEMARILDLTPAKAALRLRKIEDELKGVKPRAPSNMPPPIEPITPSSKGEGNINDPNLPMSDFIRIRDRQAAERWKARERR